MTFREALTCWTPKEDDLSHPSRNVTMSLMSLSSIGVRALAPLAHAFSHLTSSSPRVVVRYGHWPLAAHFVTHRVTMGRISAVLRDTQRSSLPSPDILHIDALKVVKDREGRTTRSFVDEFADKPTRKLAAELVRSIVDALGNDASTSLLADDIAIRVWYDPPSGEEAMREASVSDLARVFAARDALEVSCSDLGIVVPSTSEALRPSLTSFDRTSDDVADNEAEGVDPPSTPPREAPSDVVRAICGVRKLPVWRFAKEDAKYDVSDACASAPSTAQRQVVTEQSEAEAIQAAFGAKVRCFIAMNRFILRTDQFYELALFNT